MISNYVLAWGLTFGQPIGNILPDQDAPRYIAKAIYRQQGWDRIVTRIEKKYIKLDDYPELAYIGIVGRIVSERRITYTWEF